MYEKIIRPLLKLLIFAFIAAVLVDAVTNAQAPSGPIAAPYKAPEKGRLAPAEKQGGEMQGSLWGLEEQTSELDGKKTQVLFQASSKRVPDWLGKEKEVSLNFSCRGDEILRRNGDSIGPILRFDGGFEGSDFHQGTSWTSIRYRFQIAGEMTVVREVQWFTGRQYAAPVHSRDFVVEAFRSDLLLIEFTPFRGSAFTARFDLRGLKSALGNLETCKGLIP